MEDYKKHLLYFILVLISVSPISVGLFLIANGISNLHISEITTQLNEVAEQIKSLEATISEINFQDFEKIVGNMNTTLFLLSSSLNNLPIVPQSSNLPTPPELP